ncbi:hypothetical protein [Streptomyces sp. NPDC057280]|uniref:hypothetical protein n=1 Tax=Streptomyces sp. NPDC057280 TaxID=3346081 RepID=UPI00363E7683
MANTLSSRTAAADVTGCTADIDVTTIRASCHTVLAAPGALPSRTRDVIGPLLLGHVQLLGMELATAAPGMRGEWRPVTAHVLASTWELLADGPDVPLWELAIQCRALLTIHEQSGPADHRLVAGRTGT